MAFLKASDPSEVSHLFLGLTSLREAGTGTMSSPRGVGTITRPYVPS
jgi:hypothetical protein